MICFLSIIVCSEHDDRLILLTPSVDMTHYYSPTFPYDNDITLDRSEASREPSYDGGKDLMIVYPPDFLDEIWFRIVRWEVLERVLLHR